MNYFSPCHRARSHRKTAVVQLVGLFWLIFSCGYAFADRKANILLVASKSTPDYVAVLTAVSDQLQSKNSRAYEFNLRYRPTGAELKTDIPQADYIVTVGTTAADTVYSLKPKVPVISVLITKDAFSALAKKHYGSVDEAFAARISSICLDQPVTRSVQLAKLLIPEASDIGVMLGPASAHRKAWLGEYITNSEMKPRFVSISAKDNPIHKIEPVLSRSDVFIPISDTRLINIATAKWILHLSYRHKVPVIAFSKSYLKAGALAAIYSSPADVAKDTADWLLKSGNSQVGGLFKPNHYSLEFNRSVAANLRVDLKAEQNYRKQFAREAANVSK